MSKRPAFIAALDVGTTSVRCFVVDEQSAIKGSAAEQVDLLNPQPGYFEIEPEVLWQKIIKVINNAVNDAHLAPSQITCLGISTQRCTFLTWNHETQEYFHNFITWKDLRADKLVEQYNAGYGLRTLNVLSYALYLVTRSKRFLAASVIKMMNGQVTLRLLHTITSNARLRQAIKTKKARLEFLDSWILYKLRSGNGRLSQVEHITDITSCTATGLFDPFTLSWSPLVKIFFGIDTSIFPKVVDNSYRHFGYIEADALGPAWLNTEVPIAASMSDQTAAIWGSQCFHKGDVKVTMGTGAFLDVITGSSCPASIMGMYPLVAWQRTGDKGSGSLETTFCMEGAAHDMGTVVNWAQACGLFSDPRQTSSVAQLVDSTNGVYFVPAFSGLGAPINDHRAGTGFIGVTPSTKREHLVRAILESIAFRLVQICETAQKETKYKFKLLKVDGGVSRNDFVCQYLADATGIAVERAVNPESSVMGATFMAGLNHGVWPDVNALCEFRKIECVFSPHPERYVAARQNMQKWTQAVERFQFWY